MSGVTRYALFSGDYYYPEGGWFDYRGSFGTLEGAQAAYTPREFGWAHVVDLDTAEIVSNQDGRVATWEKGA